MTSTSNLPQPCMGSFPLTITLTDPFELQIYDPQKPIFNPEGYGGEDGQRLRSEAMDCWGFSQMSD